MQDLLSYPRNATAITRGQVSSLLTGQGTKYSYGLELIYPTIAADPLSPAAISLDISDIIMPGSSVSYDNTAKIGGTANFVLDPMLWADLGNNSLVQSYTSPTDPIPPASQALYWGNPRTWLRPYMVLSSPSVSLSAKFYLGAYIPATPNALMDSSKPVYTVSCYDVTSILDIPLVNDLAYLPGQFIRDVVYGVLNTVRDTIGGFGPNIHYSESNNALATARVLLPQSFPANGSTTYLDVINALLVSASCYPLWADSSGYLVISGWADPRVAPIGWTFDQTDPTQSMVDPQSTWSPDVWKVPNKWVFVLSGSPNTPIESNGLYTITNQNTGPSSINRQLGRVIQSYHELNAISQADLVTQGKAIMIQETSIGETFQVNTAPLPIAGHADAVLFVPTNIEPNMYAPTATNVRRCAVQSWQLPLNGDPMTWSWGTVG